MQFQKETECTPYGKSSNLKCVTQHNAFLKNLQNCTKCIQIYRTISLILFNVISEL